LTFGVGAIVPVLTALIVDDGLLRRSSQDNADDGTAPLGWGRNFLSYGTAWSQGFLEGGMLAFLVLFLEARGLATATAGLLMSVMMLGVILFQVPMSWLADHCGKTPMLLVCYGLVASGLASIPWLPNGIWLAIALFTFGAFTGAMYPLGLSLLSDRMPAHGLARAYAWYLAIECIGSQLGAAAMGKARDHWGETSMFAIGLAAIIGVLVSWVAVRAWLTKSAGSPCAAAETREHRQAA
jgi:MFS family permease